MKKINFYPADHSKVLKILRGITIAYLVLSILLPLMFLYLSGGGWGAIWSALYAFAGCFSIYGLFLAITEITRTMLYKRLVMESKYENKTEETPETLSQQ